MTQNKRDRLIVALDLPDALSALALVDKLGDTVTFYKIGLGMLTGGGLALANELKDAGKQVFLDLKLFDIGATVEAAVRGHMQFAPDFMTVHGDPHVVRAAVKGRGDRATRLLAVTFLTSLDRADLDDGLIRDGDLAELVTERARRAFLAGADAMIRALPESQGRLIVTPGVRPAGAALGDQKRVETPAAAITAGADHVVVGRPIEREFSYDLA